MVVFLLLGMHLQLLAHDILVDNGAKLSERRGPEEYAIKMENLSFRALRCFHL